MAQADAQAQELSALTLQNDVEDPAGTLTSLPDDLLHGLLEFLKVDDAPADLGLEAVRSAARNVLTRVLLKPVKFVAEHGEQTSNCWQAGAFCDTPRGPRPVKWVAVHARPCNMGADGDQPRHSRSVERPGRWTRTRL